MITPGIITFISNIYFLLKGPKPLINVPGVTNLLTPIVLDGLNCRGSEEKLGDCGRLPAVEGCTHMNDAGAFCTNVRGWQQC